MPNRQTAPLYNISSKNYKSMVVNKARWLPIADYRLLIAGHV